MVISALPDQGEQVLKIKQDRTESLNRFLLDSNPPLIVCQRLPAHLGFLLVLPWSSERGSRSGGAPHLYQGAGDGCAGRSPRGWV